MAENKNETTHLVWTTALTVCVVAICATGLVLAGYQEFVINAGVAVVISVFVMFIWLSMG